jgi:hypothetical protein
MAGRKPRDLDTLRRRIERYRDLPDDDTTAAAGRLGRRLLDGGEIRADDAVTLGRTASLVSVTISDFESAGYRVRRRRGPGGNGVTYSLEGGASATPSHVGRTPLRRPLAPPKSRARSYQPEGDSASTGNVGGAIEHVAPSTNGGGRQRAPIGVPGVEYPALGALLVVRAVALVEGGLVLHLGDGGSGVWQVAVTGHAPA